jgi:uncharacterized membrane protein (DUF485 family)
MSSPIQPPDRHAPQPADAHDRRASRIGLMLFAVYCLAYGGFMGLSAFAPSVVSALALPGITVAVVYGFGLIIGAFILAVVYLVLARGDAGNQP